MARTVKFVSWNDKGLGSPAKRGKVFQHLKKLKAGVIFMQETHLRVCDHTRLRRNGIDKVYHSAFNSRSRGAAILIHKRLQFTPEDTILDPQGRYVIVVGILCQVPVVLVSVYAPNFDSPRFMTDLFAKIPCLSTHRLIFGGDLNLTMDPVWDRSSTKTRTPIGMARTLGSLMDRVGGVDVWRHMHPGEKEFSFYSHVREQ